MLELLQHPIYALALMALLGACVGSFLNVVILRLPVMLKQQWHQQCEEFLNHEQQGAATEHEAQPGVFSLNRPASHCPQCKQALKPWHNIPILSYIFLGARCAWCKNQIPWRYPLVELVTALGTVHLALHFGVNWQLAGALLLFWSLLCLTVIDIDHQLLPDNITIPLLWAGILANYFGLFTTLESAVIGAVAGYLCFWLIFQIHYRLTGREGLGYGDFKLLAALGAWLGWEMLPLIVLLASLTGPVISVAMMAFRKLKRRTAISFGPYLAMGGWIALVWGQTITGSYIQLLGF